MAGLVRPPNSMNTGWPSAWPLTSHRAMSTALMAASTAPFRPIGDRRAVHFLEQILRVERVLADQKRRQLGVDDLLGDVRTQPRVADADEPVVGVDFDDQPTEKTKRRLRIALERQCAERRGEDRVVGLDRPFPAVEFRANVSDFHAGLVWATRKLVVRCDGGTKKTPVDGPL